MTVTVVAAAVVDGMPPRVLAAQRSYPPELAGLWELPGGKVHDGEDDLDALVRECREELGVTVAPGSRVCADVTIGADTVLRVWWARLVRGEPQAHEHAALRWLMLEELDEVPWLPSDAPVMAAVRRGWPGSRGAVVAFPDDR
jgi:8-oxo-dGTP diphosphatase